MNKDKEIEQLNKYNNQYLDWINKLENKIILLETEIETIKRQYNNQFLNFQDRINYIEQTLKQYHIE